MQRAVVADAGHAHRFAEVVVQVVGDDGAPLVDEEVVVAQTRHRFSFGCIGFDLLDLAEGAPGPGDERLAALWLGLFDTATLPFYWREFEPVRGQPRTQRLEAAARWFGSRGVRVKGHPLAWHTLAPRWLGDLSTAEVERVLLERVHREVSGFRGLVGTWDVVNELVIMPRFTAEENALTRLAAERGRVPLAVSLFEAARAADPSATLVLNDFDLSVEYEDLVEAVLEAGAPVDAIGLQTHMHQGYRGEDAVTAVLDRFSRFGLPLHLTETTLVSGDLMPADVVDLNDHVVDEWPSTDEGEARQADELVRHVTSAFAHPAVDALTWWGITDRDAWLGAPVGLVRTDGTTKPSYGALHELVRQRWSLPPTRLMTDGDGRVAVHAARGDYALTCGGQSVAFAVGDVPAVRVVAPHGSPRPRRR